SPCQERNSGALLRHHEIVPAELAAAGRRNVEQQHRIKDTVAVISRLTWEIKLRGQYAPVRSLYLHVKVTGAARIEPRNDCIEPPPALGIGELMPTEFVTAVVVSSGL